MKYEKKEKALRSGRLKVIGVYGFNSGKRIVLSLAIARILSERAAALFVSFESFWCVANILKCDNKENL